MDRAPRGGEMVELAHPFEKGLDLPLIADIQGEALHRAADLLLGLLQLVIVPAADDHLGPPGRRGLRRGQADAGGAADDDEALGLSESWAIPPTLRMTTGML